MPLVYIAEGRLASRLPDAPWYAGAEAPPNIDSYLWAMELTDKTAGQFKSEPAYPAVRHAIARGMQYLACNEDAECLRKQFNNDLNGLLRREDVRHKSAADTHELYAGYRFLEQLEKIVPDAVGRFRIGAEIAHGKPGVVIPTTKFGEKVRQFTDAQVAKVAKGLIAAAREDVSQSRHVPPPFSARQSGGPFWPTEAQIVWGTAPR